VNHIDTSDYYGPHVTNQTIREALHPYPKDLAVDAALAGSGIIYSFEGWLRPHLNSGALKPVLEPWWQRFSGPFLYYPGRRLVPAPIKSSADPS
jgi:DNA-binding transcriptional LysR family regulator